MSKSLYLCRDAYLEVDDPSNPCIIVRAENDEEAIKIAERESVIHAVKWEAIVCDNKNGVVYENKDTRKPCKKQPAMTLPDHTLKEIDNMMIKRPYWHQ